MMPELLNSLRVKAPFNENGWDTKRMGSCSHHALRQKAAAAEESDYPSGESSVCCISTLLPGPHLGFIVYFLIIK